MAGLSAFGVYRQVFRAKGAWGFVTAGFVSRLTTSMLGLSLILAITANGGHYAVAGAVAASVVLACGVCGPITGRLVDRYGQAAVLLVVTVSFAVVLSAMVIAVRAGVPDWALIPLALLAGATMPVTSPLVRARWTKTLAGTELLRTAYAFEGATTELVFISGPILVALVATSLGPVPGLVTVLACAVVGTLALAAQRGSQPEPHYSRTPRGGGVMRIVAMRLVFVAVLGVGGMIGSVEIVTIASASQLGHRHLTGVLLALFGVGSLVAGLLFGTLHIQTPIVRQLSIVVTSAAVVLIPLLFASGIVSLALLLILAGVAMSPVTITANEIVQRIVPASAFTESTFWLTTAMAFGMTAGNLVGGFAVDHRFAGNHLYLVPVMFGVVVAATVLAGQKRLTRDAEAVEQLPVEQPRDGADAIRT